jgi:geranyl-CoA carboxylase beta subunit
VAIIENTIALSGSAFQAGRRHAGADRPHALARERIRAASAAAKDRSTAAGNCCRASGWRWCPGSPFLELSTLAGCMFDVPDVDKACRAAG